MDRRRAWERANPERAQKQRADANRRYRRRLAVKGLAARLNKLPGIDVEQVLVQVGVPRQPARQWAVQRSLARTSATEETDG